MDNIIKGVRLKGCVKMQQEEGSLYSWVVPGNPIGCKLPENFQGKEMEISVDWGLSPRYTVTANLVNTAVNDMESSVEVDSCENVEELQRKYPNLFDMEGDFYIM